MAITAKELKQNLKHFNGTEQYYFNPMYPQLHYTDGVKYFCEQAGAYWFLDIIGTEIHKNQTRKEMEFSLICLSVEDTKAKITAQVDSDCPDYFTKNINFTDCPEGLWKFYLIDDILLLPSEY